jgi:hypothetical protein
MQRPFFVFDYEKHRYYEHDDQSHDPAYNDAVCFS